MLALLLSSQSGISGGMKGVERNWSGGGGPFSFYAMDGTIKQVLEPDCCSPSFLDDVGRRLLAPKPEEGSPLFTYTNSQEGLARSNVLFSGCFYIKPFYQKNVEENKTIYWRQLAAGSSSFSIHIVLLNGDRIALFSVVLSSFPDPESKMSKKGRI